MKFYMIVNIYQAYDAVIGYGDMRLQPKCKPSVIYWERGTAETEMLRLQEKNPEGEFVLLESVAVCKVDPLYSSDGVLIRIEDIEE